MELFIILLFVALMRFIYGLIEILINHITFTIDQKKYDKSKEAKLAEIKKNIEENISLDKERAMSYNNIRKGKGK